MTSDVEAEPEARDRQRTVVVRFARDVSINVLANLVAAAIIYLVGTVAGLLPRSPYLIFSSSVIILIAIGLAIGVLGLVLRARAKMYLLSVSMIVVGVGAIAVPFIADLGLNTMEKIGYPILGVSSIAMGITAVHVMRWTRRLGLTSTKDRG